MHLRTRTWFIISLLCFLGAVVFWQLAEQKAARDAGERPQPGPRSNAPNQLNLSVPPGTPARATNAIAGVPPGPAATVVANTNPPHRINDLTRHRIANTTRPLTDLQRSDTALLLRNALIDSASGQPLAIPGHLKGGEDSGSYVVQSRGLITEAFRKQLAQMGATIISYVPNNAYLVRVAPGAVAGLKALPQVQAVVSWEPYFKLSPNLLAMAVEQRPLLPGTHLNVVVFADQYDVTRQALKVLDADITQETRTPFGPMLVVRPAVNTLATIAQLPGVQGIEQNQPRVPMNDLSRARVDVSPDVTNKFDGNYKGLQGRGVLVNVNDTGVDSMHPDLAGRVFGDTPFTIQDFDGHGTHVAGIIASAGLNGPLGQDVAGSFTNSDFHGMAPAANIFAMPIDLSFGPSSGDAYLQETAALTNATISNNSWGYPGDQDYTFSSASWDAATRDALPAITGPQPITFVFSAGNEGDGEDDGTGGLAGSVTAPATAKNVITVGAIENFRQITNEVTQDVSGEMVKTAKWLGMTDSSNQVARFSARGNVGIGIEGDAGRRKPDLVAPGTFVVSTRSIDYIEPSESIIKLPTSYPGQTVPRGRTNDYTIFVPFGGNRLIIQVISNSFSPSPFPQLPIMVRPDDVPGPQDLQGYNRVDIPVSEGTWFFSIGNTNNFDVRCDIRLVIHVTIDAGDEQDVLGDLNEALKPNYRFETGTSQAAPVVSGMLALMQEFFATTGTSAGNTNQVKSPALMKALLINGARALEDYYFEKTSTLNFQGWGLVSLTNSIPEFIKEGTGVTPGSAVSGSTIYFDQSVGRALVTGQTITRNVTLSAAAQNAPLRITLVWTDPPGNPAVASKLVNDLDLYVTNLVTRDVYVGNNFGSLGIFTTASVSNTASADVDSINNVENVFLNRRTAASYDVAVVARRVDVNALTTHPTGIAQDYALVISSDAPVADAISVTEQQPNYVTAPVVTILTNGVPALDQRVGANSPLIADDYGASNQWHFFIVTNRLPASDPNAGAGDPRYIAFRTFLPQNSALPRYVDADIDLYVSDQPGLTNLDNAVINGAFKSLRRGGSESIVLSNVAPDTLFYIGVKSEDQQSARFAIFAISSSSPFSSEDDQGNIVMQAVPYVAEIPDGEPGKPEAVFLFLFPNDDSRLIRNVIVTNTITHSQGGDLQGILSHEGQLATLNNHRPFIGTETYIYDDSESGEIPFSQPVDGPGSLLNFVGQDVSGDWMMTMIDNSPFHTGRVDYLTVTIIPQLEGTNDLFIGGRRIRGNCETIPAFSFSLPIPIQVPGDATNLYACVSPENGPVEVYIRRQDVPGQFPTRIDYDTFATFLPPGDCLFLNKRDSPPLSQGLYIVRYYNPNGSPLRICHGEGVDRDPTRTVPMVARAPNSAGLFDDATTNRIIHVNRDQIVADVEVGVRISHPRVSDLVLHLVSPSGTRILLAENRGGPNGEDYGFGERRTDVLPSTDSGDANASTNVIGTLQNEGTLQIDYNFLQVPDQLIILYEGNLLYDSGLISGAGTISVDYGPGLSTNIVVIMNPNGNPNAGTLWAYTATVYTGFIYAIFSENPDRATIPIKFALPPFTNNNYYATNVFTNATILIDSFEDGQAGAPVYAPPGVVSGWTVAGGDVVTLGPENTNQPPWFIGPDTGFRFLDINGPTPPGSIYTNFPTTPGATYRVSFAYAQGPAGNQATADVLIGPALGLWDFIMNLAPPPNSPGVWTKAYFDYQASQPNTTLNLEATSLESAFDIVPLAAVLFDSFMVEEIHTEQISGIYFQPEESLSPLRGENAFGDWELEIWDSRAGAAATNMTLLSWRLNLTFVETNPPAFPLTNGIPYCGFLGSNEMAFFRVDVPITAAAVTNSLISLDGYDLDLVFSQFGEPIPLEPPDTFFLTRTPYGTNVLDIAGWNSYDPFGFAGGSIVPTLQPGRRYYLAVRNRFPGVNTFCIQADFDQLSPNLTDVIPLTNNQCYVTASTMAEIQYYSFDVGSNALTAEFTITNITGSDVDLVIRRGVPLPTLTLFDAASTNATPTNYEHIEISDFTTTLLPGRWYIGVVHRDDQPTGYEICVRARAGAITPLISGRTNCSFLATGQVAYYSINVGSNVFLADFFTTNTFGNVDLYLSTNTMTPVFAPPTNALHSAANAGDEFIRVFADQLVNPLTPGLWYLAVANPYNIPATYCVGVNLMTTNPPYILLTNGIPYCQTNTQASPIGLFRFDVATNALQAVFETFGATDDVDLYIRRFPVPIPGPRFNTYSSTNSGTTNEYIALLPPNRTPRLQPGPWYISVIPKNPLTAPIPFKIRVTQILSNQVVSLANGVGHCRTDVVAVDTNALHSGVHFYSFVVPPNAVQAVFETYGATTNVDLYVQYNLPITNFSLFNAATAPYPYASTNGGTTNEFISVSTNSLPQRLTNGTWYLAVVNRGGNHSNIDGAYCVRASIWSRTNVTRLSDGIDFCTTTTGITNGGPIAGIDYYVFTVHSNAILATFETFNAFAIAEPPYPADVDIYLSRTLGVTNFAVFDPASTNYPYASANLGPAAEFIGITTNTPPVPLAAGDWYLAVVNRNTNAISYCVRASQTLGTNVVPIDPGVPACRTVGTGGSGANASVEYLRFNVSTSAVVAAITTYNADGDIDIYVSRDLAFANLEEPVPGLTYPYGSANPGLTPECVSVSLNSTPVALTNGEWYVAVVNRSANRVNYCISITEIQASELVPLVNGEACTTVQVTNSAGNIGVIYHPVIVSSNALQLTVESFNASGNVDLYLQRGLCFFNTATFPLGASNAPYASTIGGPTNEMICVSTASAPVPLTPGEWYIAVVNRENAPVDYCVRTTELLDSQVTSLTNGVPSPNGPLAPGEIAYFRYNVSTNAVRVNFETLLADADVDLFVEGGGFCPTDLLSFAYSSTNVGTGDEFISVTVASRPIPLVPGDWFIAVRNNSGGDANYTVLVTEFGPGPIIPLTNAIPYANVVAGFNDLANLPVDYYRFTVSTNAVRAQFEILQPSGDVNLYVRKGLPPPAPYDYDYRSFNAGTGEELVNIFTNSSPVRLTPGDWYLAVVNTTTNPVSYVVLATEYTQWGTNLHAGDITVSSSNICFTWTGTLTGVNYYVQGKPNLDFTNWFAVSPTIKAVTNEITWCVELPSPYHFFQLVEGLSGLSVGPPTTLTGLSFSNNVFIWQWTADPTLRFGVEWTDTFSPPYWQPFPVAVTSTDGTFVFIDDGTLTGGVNPSRFYRIQVLP